MTVYPFGISQRTVQPPIGFINTSQQSFPTQSSARQPVADVDRVLLTTEVLEICTGVINVLHLHTVTLNVTAEHLHILTHVNHQTKINDFD